MVRFVDCHKGLVSVFVAAVAAAAKAVVNICFLLDYLSFVFSLSFLSSQNSFSSYASSSTTTTCFSLHRKALSLSFHMVLQKKSRPGNVTSLFVLFYFQSKCSKTFLFFFFLGGGADSGIETVPWLSTDGSSWLIADGVCDVSDDPSASRWRTHSLLLHSLPPTQLIRLSFWDKLFIQEELMREDGKW